MSVQQLRSRSGSCWGDPFGQLERLEPRVLFSGDPLGYSSWYPGFVGDSDGAEYVTLANASAESVEFELSAIDASGSSVLLGRGSLAPWSRDGVTLRDFRDGVQRLEQDEQYSLELRAELPLSATLARYDQDGAIGAAFIEDPASDWVLPFVGRNGFSETVWIHNTGDDTTISAQLIQDGRVREVLTFDLDANGSASIDSSQLPLGRRTGDAALRITGGDAGDELIVAIAAEAQRQVSAFGHQAVPGMGASSGAFGVLPANTLESAEIVLANPSGVDAMVQVSAIVTTFDAPLETISVMVPAYSVLRLDSVDLTSFADEPNLSAYVAYASNTDIAAAAFELDSGDASAEIAASIMSRSWSFADTYVSADRSGIDYLDTLSIFNPGDEPVSIELTAMTFFGIGESRRIVVEAGTAQEIELSDDGIMLRNFARAPEVGFVLEASAPIVAHLQHTDQFWNGRWSAVGTPDASRTPLALETVSSQPRVRSLSADTTTLLANEADTVFFSAVVDSAVGFSSIELRNLDDDGNIGSLVTTLRDDGSALAADALASDGVFSGFLALQLDAGQTQRFIAVLPGQSSGRSIELVGTDRPTDAQLDAERSVGDMVASITSGYTDASTGANATRLARAELVQIDALSDYEFSVSDTGVFWRGPSGGLYGHFVNPTTFDDSTLRDRGGRGRGGTVEMSGPCGDALILAPYFVEFEGIVESIFGVGLRDGDASDELVDLFEQAEYEVTEDIDGVFSDVSFSSFIDFSSYGFVYVSSHGAFSQSVGTLIATGLTADEVRAQHAAYASDIASGRLVQLSDGSIAITSAFVRRYAGAMDDSIVYIDACQSLRANDMATAFLQRGAAAYMGHTDNVQTVQASSLAVSTAVHLLGGGAVANAPDMGATLLGTGGRFTFAGDGQAMLPDQCSDFALYIRYDWNQTVRDLDTATSFLGSTVGYACGPSGTYLDWSGDDTSAGGREIVEVDFAGAFRDGGWSGMTTVELFAGWYAPAEGSGPATVSIGRIDESTGEVTQLVQQTVNPGSQRDCAATPVASVVIQAIGSGEDLRFEYDIMWA